MEEKILTLHPQGKKGVNISKARYELMRKTILYALGKKREASRTELGEAVESSLKDKFEGSIPWYFEATKLDLEARKVIERAEGTKAATYRVR